MLEESKNLNAEFSDAHMKAKEKNIIPLIVMLLCATLALLMHPFIYIVGFGLFIEDPQIIIFYYLSYGIIGTLLWHLFREKALWKQVLAIFLGVNFVLFAFLIIWLYYAKVNDGMTVLMFLWISVINAILSTFPIWLSCWFIKKHNTHGVRNKVSDTLCHRVSDTL